MIARRRKLRLVVPEEPPLLTPGVARALLTILLKAAAGPAKAIDQTTEGITK
ncbi:hypothetical protein [Actinomadura craniellae]|uniref:hypothetical protein n=1 Tax=Actinomadura craniellae TaxID=2231787 RepID=UPI001314ED68|nr:hypothetical protein [Actinomadura craniellae]